MGILTDHLCECGCGQATNIEKHKNRPDGTRKGEYRRYARGHGRWAHNPLPVLSTHLCECGCGGFTEVATSTNRAQGYVRGEPNRFIVHHHNRIRGDGPNPSGICQCGCRLPTPRAIRSRCGVGKGQHYRYLQGHTPQHPSLPPHERFWRFVCKTESCWLWVGGTTAFGYGVFGIKSINHAAHRLSWKWAYGAIPPGMFVCHHCDTPACVRPDHLFLGTAQDNNRDAVRKGRAVRLPNGRLSRGISGKGSS